MDNFRFLAKTLIKSVGIHFSVVICRHLVLAALATLCTKFSYLHQSGALMRSIPLGKVENNVK